MSVVFKTRQSRGKCLSYDYAKDRTPRLKPNPAEAVKGPMSHSHPFHHCPEQGTLSASPSSKHHQSNVPSTKKASNSCTPSMEALPRKAQVPESALNAR